MKKLFFEKFYLVQLLFWTLLLGILLGHTRPFPTPLLAQEGSGGWQATYWNNTELSGQPVLQLFEADQNHNPELDRNWGSWRPWPQVETDYFSARWQRTVFLASGRYRFAATADDGIRVWVNDQSVIDEWFNQIVDTHIGYYDVTQAGTVNIKVEYYESQHDAVAKLTWDHIFGSDTAVTGQLYTPTITAWRGEYFNNGIVAGVPALVRDDAAIDFDWGLNSPAIQAINAEGFSVRWSRTLNLAAGIYRFTTQTDDGVRLYINNQLVIDQWLHQAFALHTADVNHTGGPLQVKMEYFDDVGLAKARLTWEQISATAPATATGAGVPQGYWRGEYYNNTVLATQPVLVRYDNDIDFAWGVESPVPQYITRSAFSVRWTGTLNLPAGSYQFLTSTDDGVRLWVNDQLIIDKWRKQAELTFTGQIDLPGGPVPVRMEYYNAEHIARARLDWERLDGPLPANRGLVPPAPAPVTVNQTTAAATGPVIDLPPITLPPDVLTITIGVGSLNVRAEPSILSAQIDTLSSGQTVPVLGRNQFNNWLQVVLPDNHLGWISILYVNPLPDMTQLEVVSNPTTAIPVTESGNITPTVTVNSAFNTIRAGSNMLAPQIGNLPRQTTVTAVGRNQFNTWIQVDLPDGGTGWISVLYADLNVPITALSIIEE